MADCFAAVHAAAARGLSKSAIARALGFHRHTVQKYLALDAAPERHHANRTVSILAPYEGYLLERWRQGCRDARALWREIAALGYPGSYGPVVRALRQLRVAAAAGRQVAPPGGGLTPPQAVGLLLTRPDERAPEQELAVAQVRALHPDLGAAVTLLDRFAALIRGRANPQQEARLARWMEDAEHSAIAELVAFTVKLRQDMAAVLAGLTLPWSQGQVEGQILKLKLLRRQMYGRGNVDLVRKRALRAA